VPVLSVILAVSRKSALDRIRTRKWQDKDGVERCSTEIQLPSFNGTLTFLDRKPEGEADPQPDDVPAVETAEAEAETPARGRKKAKAA
jgi:single-stranded DNA-binding protein